ncbi:oxidoreductase, aldo/keto reductase family, partial [gut metagenome]
DEVVIATKFGVSINPDRSLNISSKPDEIKETVEHSLDYLGVDQIQMLYQHRIDRSTEPEVVAETVADLMDAGLVQAWGISEVDEEYLRRAHAVCPVAAIENRYSMMARWHASLFPTLEELDIAYVAFSPMANGFLLIIIIQEYYRLVLLTAAPGRMFGLAKKRLAKALLLYAPPPPCPF